MGGYEREISGKRVCPDCGAERYSVPCYNGCPSTAGSIDKREFDARNSILSGADEESRLVKILLQRAWPQIDLRGTIEFFGLEGTDVGDNTAMRRMSGALERICERVGFDRPPPSMGQNLGPRTTGGTGMTTTDKQQVILDKLNTFYENGKHPTVRELADELESDESRSERFSDDEVRGLLERLEADGKVKQYESEGDQRYEPVLETA